MRRVERAHRREPMNSGHRQEASSKDAGWTLCKKQKRDLLGYFTAAVEAHRDGMLPPVLIATP